ncbi:MAG: porin [Nitrospirae bacterium]|nr:porin [Nitrospirota bacterium]
MQAVTNKAVKQWVLGTAMTVAALGAPAAYGADPAAVMDGLKGVSVKGYVEGQYNYNFNTPGPIANPTTGSVQANDFRVFDTKANSFTFNMAELSLTKGSDKGAGFGLVLNYGLDADSIASAPFFNAATVSDFAVQQAYVTEKFLGGALELRLGKYATLAGAEVIEGPSNYNISRSFLFGWAIPFTHTGIRAAYTTPVPGLSLIAGLNNGWDAASDSDTGKTVELQAAYAPVDMISLGVTGYYGPEASVSGTDNRGLVDVLATIKPMKTLAVVVNYDRGSQKDTAVGNSLWQGYAVYANLGIGDKHAVTLRGEVFDDPDGFKTGFVQTLKELTATVSCKMVDSLELRAEVRHDESNQDVFVDDKGVAKDNQNTVALAAYYTF